MRCHRCIHRHTQASVLLANVFGWIQMRVTYRNCLFLHKLSLSLWNNEKLSERDRGPKTHILVFFPSRPDWFHRNKVVFHGYCVVGSSERVERSAVTKLIPKHSPQLPDWFSFDIMTVDRIGFRCYDFNWSRFVKRGRTGFYRDRWADLHR